jgi:hypothetical protein
MRKAVLSVVVVLSALGLQVGVAHASHSTADLRSAVDAFLAFEPLATLSPDAAASSASQGGRDFAVGGGFAAPFVGPAGGVTTTAAQADGDKFAFSAHQTTGVEAWGHIRVNDSRARVGCLIVTGNTAILGGEVTSGPTSPISPFLLVLAVDSGLPGGEGDLFRHTTIGPVLRCDSFPAPGFQQVIRGNIVVHDSP